jgi:cellular retinoic acid-binding protein 1
LKSNILKSNILKSNILKSIILKSIILKSKNFYTSEFNFKLKKLGSYTVRTETTVRTTELNFTLGEPFEETTLDGRVTATIPTRIGNVLTLDQNGDPGKGEMNTQQIRDFQGDKMLMSLVAGDVICYRHYEKIRE